MLLMSELKMKLKYFGNDKQTNKQKKDILSSGFSIIGPYRCAFVANESGNSNFTNTLNK